MWQMPGDDLDTVREQVKRMTDLNTHLIEENMLRPRYISPDNPSDAEEHAYKAGESGTAAEQEGKTVEYEQPWFARNIVDHR